MDNSNTSYMSKKEQNYLWLDVKYFIISQFFFIEFQKIGKLWYLQYEVTKSLFFF